MSITDELNELIALHGNCRDALNVTLAKLRHAQDEIAILKEAAQQSVHLTLCGRCQNPVTEQNVYCPKCGQWNPANRR